MKQRSSRFGGVLATAPDEICAGQVILSPARDIIKFRARSSGRRGLSGVAIVATAAIVLII